MRILVVEDSRSLADGIAEGLRDQGMAVDVAYDGREAAAKLDLSPYQVVVLDRDIPGLHGDTLCRMITDSINPAMVLMLTAAGAPGDRVAGLSLGADDYLPKPFHFPELVLRIRALARRQPAARPRIYRAADLELDTLRHAVMTHREIAASLVTHDDKGALLRSSFNEDGLDYKALFDGINAIVSKYSDANTEIFVAGQPVISGWGYYYLPRITIIIHIIQLSLTLRLVSLQMLEQIPCPA